MPRTIGNPHGWPDYTWPMVWVLQDAELWPIEQWVAHQGTEKFWTAGGSAALGVNGPYTIYTVPVGKVLYLTRYLLSARFDYWAYLDYTPSGTFLSYLYGAAKQPFQETFAPPVTIGAGQSLRITIDNYGPAIEYWYAVIRGFELSV